jgi:hypothetical protein
MSVLNELERRVSASLTNPKQSAGSMPAVFEAIFKPGNYDSMRQLSSSGILGAKSANSDGECHKLRLLKRNLWAT